MENNEFASRGTIEIMEFSYLFDEPLILGIIKSRPNRFIMNVEIDNEIVKCHCPTTGRIGNIIFEDIPCLLSRSKDKKRKTPYTVEAISVDDINESKMEWIGINQNAINKYVEHFLKTGQLDKIVSNNCTVLREQTLGNSRLDFKVDDTYIEVKMPLLDLPNKKGAKKRKHGEFKSFDRFIKHISELAQCLETHGRAILLNCFQFNAPRFKVQNHTDKNYEIVQLVSDSLRKGVEMWQINIEIDRNGVRVIDYYDITSDFKN